MFFFFFFLYCNSLFLGTFDLNVVLVVCLKPLADAEGARKQKMIELLKSHGGLSYVSS